MASRIQPSGLLKRTLGSVMSVIHSSAPISFPVDRPIQRQANACTLGNSIKNCEDAYQALRPKTRVESEGLDFGLFVSEFEMVLPGNIESYMARRASRPKEQSKVDGWFYFPEFEAVAEEYTRVKYDPEALKAFTEARTRAVQENLEFRARRGRWMRVQEAKDRLREARQQQREGEFLAIFRRHLPERSEQNPLHPPDEMVLREVGGLNDFLMEQDGEIPVTSERLKKISRSLMAHCEAFNRKIRRMLVMISKRIPVDKPFTMTDSECCEYLGRATTIFLTHTGREETWHTYRSFTFRMGRVREKKALFGMLDDFYVNNDYSQRVGTLLECMGLARTATLDAAIASQAELKLVCRCRGAGFKQPGSFLELVSDSAKRGEFCAAVLTLESGKTRGYAAPAKCRLRMHGDIHENWYTIWKVLTPRFPRIQTSENSQGRGLCVKIYGTGSPPTTNMVKLVVRREAREMGGLQVQRGFSELLPLVAASGEIRAWVL